jgi:hypothetical protein
VSDSNTHTHARTRTHTFVDGRKIKEKTKKRDLTRFGDDLLLIKVLMFDLKHFIAARIDQA